MAVKAIAEYVTQPDVIASAMDTLFKPCHHSAEDVAMDALDAFKHGSLTRQQALTIVETCLQEVKPTIDISSRRSELEALFR